MGRLDNKVVIVTGAAGGMGETHARLFVEEGAKVVLTDLDEEKGQKVADDLGDNAIFVKQDTTSADDWDNVVKTATEKFGEINGLVNNAGISGDFETPVFDVAQEDYQQVMDVNVYGVLLGIQKVFPSMKKTEDGSIVNISSIAGIGVAKNASPYATSKFAVRGLTKAAAADVAEYGIRVNSIHPDTIQTDLLENTSDEMIENAKNDIPLDRFADPKEISKLALFLISDDSSYSTGAEFIADGGRTAMY